MSTIYNSSGQSVPVSVYDPWGRLLDSGRADPGFSDFCHSFRGVVLVSVNTGGSTLVYRVFTR
ncbi:MAG: hypothetical protein R2751_08350 [Bacteroidales bacterium]